MNRPINVLIVEDSVADTEIDVLALQSAGFSVKATRVETEEAYLAALRSERPDVVLSDHSMPRFDAHRALDLLRRQDPDIPFILVSGKIGELAAVEMMKAGANDFVIKSQLARLAPAVRREIREYEDRLRARETRRKLAERELTLENLMQNLPGMVYRLRHDGGGWRFEFASAGAMDLIGHAPEKLVADGGMAFERLVFDCEEASAAEILAGIEKRGRYAGEHRIRTADGEVKWAWHRATGVRDEDGRVAHIEGFVADITSEKINQARLSYLAHHDVLTGLANRTLFEELLTTGIARADRMHCSLSLLFIDLDNFKDINDTSGHAAGDALLRAVAERLLGLSRKADTVARLGGDEFAVLVDIGNSTQDAAITAQRILDGLAEPCCFDGREVRISASIGIATFPADGRSAESLLSNADAAMYSAKEAGRNTYRFFASEMNTRARETVELRSMVPIAVKEDQFELHYQPQVDLNTGSVIAIEALLRWNHPQRGFISAARFVPLAEESGLIADVDRWVLREACRQARLWRDAGVPFGRVAVNLSARQFHDQGLPELLRRQCVEVGIEPSCIELELTETAMVHDLESARRNVGNLKDLGVTISIDDFGTGYSSLSYLKRLAVDRLKIDRDFVRELPGNADDLQICKSILALAGSMNIDVVAEGIETREQAELLREIGCLVGQGYLFARPASAVETARLLDRRKS